MSTAKAGFPDGVVTIVPGFGEIAGAALTSHPDVDTVAGRESQKSLAEARWKVIQHRL